MDLWKKGYKVEPETINFYKGECYYSDAHGNLCTVNFDRFFYNKEYKNIFGIEFSIKEDK